MRRIPRRLIDTGGRPTLTAVFDSQGETSFGAESIAVLSGTANTSDAQVFAICSCTEWQRAEARGSSPWQLPTTPPYYGEERHTAYARHALHRLSRLGMRRCNQKHGWRASFPIRHDGSPARVRSASMLGCWESPGRLPVPSTNPANLSSVSVSQSHTYRTGASSHPEGLVWDFAKK